MDATAVVRRSLCQAILAKTKKTESDLLSIKNAFNNLKNIQLAEQAGNYTLEITADKSITVDLDYEINELSKDIYYLNHTDEEFIQYLKTLYPDIDNYLNKGLRALKDKHFTNFITDRDGTINNYCGRYQSSIQSIYNAIYLTCFSQNCTNNSVMITSAPLKNPGIIDVSIFPDSPYILGASKGREFVDQKGNYHSYPIDQEQQEILDQLNLKLELLVSQPDYEIFSLIGSGLQFKFGQTTIARQDVNQSISETNSQNLLELIQDMVFQVDPRGGNLIIEDTGKDIEIILTTKNQESEQDFNKADGLTFLDSQLDLNLAKGNNLVCGDTASDIPMLKKVLSLSPDNEAVFVTQDTQLIIQLKQILPDILIFPYPDILVVLLYQLAKNK
ncbi:MAG: trehalose 6-phosphate synthase [Spirochaetes bacterium]|nr:trehalose 6-phosphate synthase [Spirochaetota bacterium]